MPTPSMNTPVTQPSASPVQMSPGPLPLTAVPQTRIRRKIDWWLLGGSLALLAGGVVLLVLWIIP